MENNDFFKETIINEEYNTIVENQETPETCECKSENVDSAETDGASSDVKEAEVEIFNECNNGSSLIFSRDIDYKNPYMEETRIKKKKKSNFFRYTAAVICGMFAGAIIFASALTLNGGLKFGGLKVPEGAVKLAHNSSVNAGALVGATKKKTNDGASLDVTEISEKVGPSVVGVVNNQTITSWWHGGTIEQQGSGSGIIISKDGYIITNSHVIEGASSIDVVLSTGEEYDAKLIGQDVKTDLAVLKIEAKNLPAAELGKSSELKVGELAVAIGNPLGLEFQGSVTAGVISALNRTIDVEGRQYTLVQTDAAINPGNSGGPLVNRYGQIIGINTVKISTSDTEGMGFAIPIDVAAPIVEELINHGYVSGRPQIGVGIREITEDMSKYYNLPIGVYVVSVSEGSGAEKAGILIGDVIIKADGKTVTNMDELNEVRDTHKAGETLKLDIVRSGKNMTVNVTLGEEKPAN